MLDAGYKIVDDAFNLPFDIYIKGGFAKFLENGYDDDVYENTLYVKAYYDFDFWQNRVRFGAAEGASYTYGTLYVEKLESEKKGGNLSHYLNYLELSLDVDLGKLIKYQPLNDVYFGVVIKHRSGIFGLINNVIHGGSNYDAVYIEKNF
jgi:outer membrane protein